MRQIFGPAANSVARVVLLSILIAPFPAIALGYAVMRTERRQSLAITLFLSAMNITSLARLSLLPFLGRTICRRGWALDDKKQSEP
jgi:ABC-type proline/glycine betaine transport system permease subunit